MRFPLGSNLESRDGVLDPRDENFGPPRDARVVNGIVEARGDSFIVRKRPGLVDVGNVHNGTGQLLYNWNGLKAIVSDTIYSGTISTIIGSGTSTALSPTNTGLQYSAANTGSGAATPRMMFKNRSQAWVMNKAGTVSTVTYGGSMGAETYSVTSLTRSGGTATAVIAAEIPYSVGDSVTVAGAGQAAYNGTFTITAITPAVFTPAANVPITITRSSTTATAVSTGPHLLTSGTYTIAGANDSAYNGSKSITVVDAVTFTYTVTVTPAGTTTWNPSDKSANFTLSGGNLTATNTDVTSNAYAVRGTIGKSTGKWYWEVTPGSIGSGLQIGVANNSVSLSAFIGSVTGGWSYNNFGTFYWDGSGSVTKASFAASDVIGIALDLDGGTVTFYKNGTLQLTITGVSGTLYPAISAENGGAVTANFGATAFAQTIPSGYTALYADTPLSPASGTITVTRPAVSTPASFSYAVAGSPTTPATGTITVQGSGGTVPGIGYLNGYFIVMDTSGVVWNSAIDDPTSWGALSFLTAQSDSSRGRGIAVSRNYVVAFKEWSTEFFYDAKNATGSPFSPVDSGVLQTGCATGWSIASIDDTVFWLSQTKAKGRGVHMLSGLQSSKISTPDVDRILENVDLTTVYAYCLKTAGHTFYVLTIAQDLWVTGKDGITLVYDATSQQWGEWTTYSSVGNSTNLSSITRSGDTATGTVSNSIATLSDGGWLKISGANQSEYNGVHQVSKVNATTVKFKVSGTPLTPATGTISASFGTPTRWPFVSCIAFGDDVFFLNASNGNIINLDDATFTDSTGTYNGNGIDFAIRTPKLDGQTIELKRIATFTVIGTKVDDWCMARWTNDDFRTWTDFRFINLASEKPQLRRCGKLRRRAHEIRYTGNASPIFEAAEIEIAGGQNNG